VLKRLLAETGMNMECNCEAKLEAVRDVASDELLVSRVARAGAARDRVTDPVGTGSA
jgi:hypothetical protein